MEDDKLLGESIQLRLDWALKMSGSRQLDKPMVICRDDVIARRRAAITIELR